LASAVCVNFSNSRFAGTGTSESEPTRFAFRDIIDHRAADILQPDVAVVDIEMPGEDGISAAFELRRRLPNCRSLILTMYGKPGFIQRALEGGVSGFVLKDAPVEALASAIRRCAAGENVVDPNLAARRQQRVGGDLDAADGDPPASALAPHRDGLRGPSDRVRSQSVNATALANA